MFGKKICHNYFFHRWGRLTPSDALSSNEAIVSASQIEVITIIKVIIFMEDYEYNPANITDNIFLL